MNKKIKTIKLKIVSVQNGGIELIECLLLWVLLIAGLVTIITGKVHPLHIIALLFGARLFCALVKSFCLEQAHFQIDEDGAIYIGIKDAASFKTTTFDFNEFNITFIQDINVLVFMKKDDEKFIFSAYCPPIIRERF